MTTQFSRHIMMLAGKSEFFNPWQYRILSTYLVQAIVWIFEYFYISEPYFKAFFLFRYLEVMSVFYLCSLYYKNFTFSQPLILLSLILITYAMSNSIFGSDLSFNNYLEIIFFLIALLVINSDKKYWLLPVISFFAAINRETSIFIPSFFILKSILTFKPAIKIDKKLLLYASISLFVFIGVLLVIRLYFGFEDPVSYTGFSMLKDNLLDGNFKSNSNTFYNVFGTINISLLIVLYKYKVLHRETFLLFVIVLPLWLIINLWFGIARESRLFLVPYTIILIPGILTIIQKSFEKLAPVEIDY